MSRSAGDRLADAAARALMGALARGGHLEAVLDRMTDDECDQAFAGHQRAEDDLRRRKEGGS